VRLPRSAGTAGAGATESPAALEETAAGDFRTPRCGAVFLVGESGAPADAGVAPESESSAKATPNACGPASDKPIRTPAALTLRPRRNDMSFHLFRDFDTN
jgi:hypothetical protein